MSEILGKKVETSSEVLEKATRRRFAKAYKLQILAEADGCQAGELGKLLRREGSVFFQFDSLAS